MNLFRRLPDCGNAEKFVVLTFFQNLYLYNHVGTLYMRSRGLSLLQVNSIWSILVLTIFLAEVPTGVIADRIGRKRSVVAALFLQFLGEFFYIFASSYVAFVLIAMLGGIGYSFLSGANEALIYDSLPGKNRESAMKQAMGRVSAAYQLAFFMAPLLGGLVISELVLSRYLLGIALTAASVFVAFLISLTLKELPVPCHRRLSGALQILKDGFTQLRGNRKVQRIAAVAILTGAFSATLVNFYQPYFVQFGMTTSLPIGIALSLGGLAAFLVLSNITTIEHRLGRFGLFFFSFFPGVLYLLLAITPNIPVLFPVFVLTYAFVDAKNPLIAAYQNEQIESASRATTLSLINMIGKIYIAVVSLLLGWIANYSISAVWAAIGALILVATLLLRVDKIRIHKAEDMAKRGKVRRVIVSCNRNVYHETMKDRANTGVEKEDPPPFLRTWNRLYASVIVYTCALILALYVLTITLNR
jgi:MFS family permease